MHTYMIHEELSGHSCMLLIGARVFTVTESESYFCNTELVYFSASYN